MPVDPRASPLMILLLVACARAPASRDTPSAGSGGLAGDAPAPGSVRTAHYALSASPPRDCQVVPRGARSADVRRLGVDLTLMPLGEVQVPANPYYARLVDERGTVYEATLGGCGPALEPRLPARGEAARGIVVFEVPNSARAFTLTYAPALVGEPAREVDVALGR